MKKRNRWLKILVVSVTGLLNLSPAWAAIPDLRNQPLSDWGDSGAKSINFSDVDVELFNGVINKNKIVDQTLSVTSSSSSVFHLNSSIDEYNNTQFNGYLVINAKLSQKFLLRPGSSFAIYSTDSMFGKEYTTQYNCSKSGRKCTSGQLIYSGDLSQIGWSQNEGNFEFTINNLGGWAYDNLGQMTNSVEHILLNIDCSTQTTVDSNNCYEIITGYGVSNTLSAKADGFAVVPEPQDIIVYQ